MSDSHPVVPVLIGTFYLGFFFLYALIHVGTIIWAMIDAGNRGKSGCLVGLLVFILPFPAGLIIWLLIRPPRYEMR